MEGLPSLSPPHVAVEGNRSSPPPSPLLLVLLPRHPSEEPPAMPLGVGCGETVFLSAQSTGGGAVLAWGPMAGQRSCGAMSSLPGGDQKLNGGAVAARNSQDVCSYLIATPFVH